jgi:hypothetical protein
MEWVDELYHSQIAGVEICIQYPCDQISRHVSGSAVDEERCLLAAIEHLVRSEEAA